MSDRSPNNDADTDTRKRTDEIAFHIYTKAFQVIYAARASEQGPPLGKVDKWFNLETPVAAPLNFQSSDIEMYRSISSLPWPRPLAIQVLLAIPSSGNLVHSVTGARIFSGYHLVLLEEWQLKFGTLLSILRWSERVRSDDEDLPEPATIYKSAISLFRSVFSFLRILPAWRTTQEISGWLADSDPTQVTGRMRVILRLHSLGGPRPTARGTVLSVNQPDSILKFGASLTGPGAPLPSKTLPFDTHVFPSIPLLNDTLTLSVTYLTAPFFIVSESPISPPIPVLQALPLPLDIRELERVMHSLGLVGKAGETRNTTPDASDSDLPSQSPALVRSESWHSRPVPTPHSGNWSSSSFSEGEKSRRSSDYSSDGRGSAWMSVFSDAGSDQSSLRSSPTSNTPPSLPSLELDSQLSALGDLNLTGRVTKLGQYPFESGRTADIYRATIVSLHAPEARRSQGTQHVAVKIFRKMHYEPGAIEQMSKILYSEALIWRRLHHPNVLPFLGISLDLGLSPALISPLCASGSVMKYLKENTKDTRNKLQLTIDVANGLQYLHSEDIVHGNLCTKKILINNEGSPMICGYGMSKTLGTTSDTTSLLSTSVRFTPPECFLGDDGAHHIRTQSTDVYAFSMVVLEILSGLEPYHHLPTEHTVVAYIVRGGQPIRSHVDRKTVNDSLWQLLTSLWTAKPHTRPSIFEIIGQLIKISQQNDSTRAEEGASDEADTGLPRPDEEDDKGSSGEEIFFGHHTLPDVPGRDLKGRIIQDDQYPFAGGGNSNVYRGKLTRSDGRKIRVAIKMFRVSDDGSGHLEEIIRRLKREVDVWSKLKHRNILPFIGVCDDLAPTPVLISPFYKFGHVGTYLRKHPHINRIDIVHGIACGLQFLHVNEVVHGDLKLQNVLVDKRGTPCICDFGISKIINHHGFTTASVGTAPYMAPELFVVIGRDGAQVKVPTTTKQTDMYSFGLLVLEIMTSQPLKGRPSRPVITLNMLENLRPKRIHYDIETITDKIWSILEQCWHPEANDRPSISQILNSALFFRSLARRLGSPTANRPSTMSHSMSSSLLEGTNVPKSLDSTMTTSIAVTEGKQSRSPIRRRSSLSAILERPNEFAHLAEGKPLPPLPQHSPTRLRPRSHSVSARQHKVVASSLPTIIQQPLPALAQGILPAGQANPSRVFRKGFWNRRGDHLTDDGFVVYAPPRIAYPAELQAYPDVTVGYRDHLRNEVPYSTSHPELPESLPRFGQPPLKPYEQFVVYILVY